jgi:ketosteroid isomerase-like protein
MLEQLMGGAVLVACVSCAVAAGRMPELDEVVASERAFAARAQQVNARQAFVEYFAADAILFAPYPVRAFPQLREGPDWGVNIQWRPVAAGISGAGDMGYTTGPSEYRRAPSEPPVGYGHYTSVWQRQMDGGYRVQIDVGIKHPAPVVPPEDWTRPSEPPTVQPALDPTERASALSALRELDARVGATQGSDATLADVFADDVRLHRGGRLPVSGRAQALVDLAVHQESLNWVPVGVAVAESGDLGYAYGRGRSTGGSPADASELAYLNIWQRRGGKWRLIVHVSNAVRADEGAVPAKPSD